MTIYTIISFILWWAISYGVFYFRYQNKDIVNELRWNLKEANKELARLTQDIDEYLQQNIILKEKMSEFLTKNDDLSKVVWELSKYYYHLKKASEKTEEFVKYLKSPDPEIEERMQIYLTQSVVESNNSNESDVAKKFF